MTYAQLTKNNYSYGEIEIHCRKAAKGANMYWGLAEETGKVVRWLVEHDIDGPTLLLSLLTLREQSPSIATTPIHLDAVWHNNQIAQCPIIAGTIINDRAIEIKNSTGMKFKDIAYPALLITQMAYASEELNQPLLIKWNNFRAIVNKGEMRCMGDNLYSEKAEMVECCLLTETTPMKMDIHSGIRQIQTTTWSALDVFAQRTYAPATEASRLKGAGAGLTDND